MGEELKNLLSHSARYTINNLINSKPTFEFNKKVVLFGAYKMGETCIKLCKKNNIEILAACDNDKNKLGKFIKKIKIISPKELMKFPKNTQIIISSSFDDEISTQLRLLGFNDVWSYPYLATIFPNRFYDPFLSYYINEFIKNKKKIIKCFKLFKDIESQETFLEIVKYRLTLDKSHLKKIGRPLEDQYFDKDVVALTKSESFVDVGAYEGDTIKAFKKVTDNKFKKIYAFEPDAVSFNKIFTNTNGRLDNRIQLFPWGLSNKDGFLKFANEATTKSHLSKEGTIRIKVVALDHLLKKDKVTMLKMDIEGGEMKALKGAKGIISTQNPKIAISVYHKPSDLWEIPLYIKKINPSYSFYLRHYTFKYTDSVCYAL